MAEKKKFERFGKYLILDHLVDGGMAKICRARYLGEQANKMVAVKMVQPQFSNDEIFVRMFQDELNITFGMLHPNIMQVYDYGKTDGQLYTAMEYIHGANLKQYLDRLKEHNRSFPVETCCYIISQVCLGLHYAHTFTDKLTGKPFNIVHRDISPHNIMLSYDGAVKVIDFGIAKANTNSEVTQTGTIKGKLSYLAPEYLDGLELDCRYDEFAVGITLWEMLCSKKLFQANNDLAVLKQIQQCKIIPPSEINPNVPKELDAIVLKALSKDRSHRFENLDQMNRALVRFLYSNYPEFNASDLRVFADDLFKKELGTDREKFVEYGKIDILPYIEEMKKDEEKTGKIAKKTAAPAKTATPARNQMEEFELKIDPSVVGLEVETVNKTVGRKLSKNSLQHSNASRLHQNPNATVKGIPAKNPKSNASSLMQKKMEKTANRSSADKDTNSSSSSSNFIIIIFAASLAAILYYEKDVLTELLGLGPGRNPAGNPPISKQGRTLNRNTLKSDIATETEGKIIVGGFDLAMELFIDGKKQDFIGKPLTVALNKEVTFTVKKPGYASYVTQINLNKEKNSIVLTIPELKKAGVGLLTTSQNYTAGSKLVYEEDGVMIEADLPFTDKRIPQGTYQAKVINPILGTEKKVEFKIEENKKHFLE